MISFLGPSRRLRPATDVYEVSAPRRKKTLSAPNLPLHYLIPKPEPGNPFFAGAKKSIALLLIRERADA
jgi:hypothetical protein